MDKFLLTRSGGHISVCFGEDNTTCGRGIFFNAVVFLHFPAFIFGSRTNVKGMSRAITGMDGRFLFDERRPFTRRESLASGLGS